MTDNKKILTLIVRYTFSDKDEDDEEDEEEDEEVDSWSLSIIAYFDCFDWEEEFVKKDLWANL